MTSKNNKGSGKGDTVKVSRSAITGEFVSKEYANTHKKTTVTETVKKPTPPKKK